MEAIIVPNNFSQLAEHNRSKDGKLSPLVQHYLRSPSCRFCVSHLCFPRKKNLCLLVLPRFFWRPHHQNNNQKKPSRTWPTCTYTHARLRRGKRGWNCCSCREISINYPRPGPCKCILAAFCFFWPFKALPMCHLIPVPREISERRTKMAKRQLQFLWRSPQSHTHFLWVFRRWVSIWRVRSC